MARDNADIHVWSPDRAQTERRYHLPAKPNASFYATLAPDSRLGMYTDARRRRLPPYRPRTRGWFASLNHVADAIVVTRRRAVAQAATG